jgi:hypothetical protein
MARRSSRIILGRNEASPCSETEVEMKTLVSAIALLVGSDVIAAAAEQTLKSLKSIVLGASLAAALAPTAFAKEWKTVAIAMDGSYAPGTSLTRAARS